MPNLKKFRSRLFKKRGDLDDDLIEDFDEEDDEEISEEPRKPQNYDDYVLPNIMIFNTATAAHRTKRRRTSGNRAGIDRENKGI